MTTLDLVSLRTAASDLTDAEALLHHACHCDLSERARYRVERQVRRVQRVVMRQLREVCR